ncbi:HipA domain-containing protein [Mycobacteroides abscessus]|uniref:HipA domain-containing protein n=1 Tax=Mycobacteroides abscessus TaxID=36809 RepID=UPI000940A1BC|nr:HipA domain-containing protein [Mycobacteroides abscessus]
MPASVVDVSNWEVVADETEGQEEKLWLSEPGTTVTWLYKPPIIKGGVRQREDFAEYLACQLAGMLGVPCARVHLAIRGQARGSISRDLKPPGWEMQAGALLLAARDPNYQPGDENPKGRPGHSLQRIAEALNDAGPPPGYRLPVGFRAFDVFAGYLVLDAWIANRDRHDENWSIMLPPPPGDERWCLSASYDQAGSLAYNLTDQACAARLAEYGAVERWALKGTAWRFEHDPADGPCTLVELAVDALQRCSETARRYWLDSLANVSHATSVAVLLQDIPDLSHHWRTFASELLRINQERLLHACRDM